MNLESSIRSFLVKLSARLKPGGEEKRAPGWFERHFHWREWLYKEVLSQSTIKHRSARDYLGYTGTAAAFLLLLQFLSGLLLLLYYVPDTEKAFASVQMIRNEVPFGLLFSNLHALNAKLILLLLFAHMFRVMLWSAHRGPREPQWYAGMLLLFLTLLAGFSGYLLPWSQQSYWACVIGTEAVRAVPLLGDSLVHLLRGGENVGPSTLHRFFALHVTLLPVLLIVLSWLHIKWVWRTGVIAPPDMSAVADLDQCISCGKCERACSFQAVVMADQEGRKLPRFDKDLCNACRACEKACPPRCISFASETRQYLTEPIVPDNVIHRAKAVLFCLLILFSGVFFFAGLLMHEKVPADPLNTPEAIKPDWYFLAAYQALREVPNELLGLSALAALALVVFFLPAIDRKGPRQWRKRPVYLFLVFSAIAGFVVFTILGAL